jgi:hypothetical protein
MPKTAPHMQAKGIYSLPILLRENNIKPLLCRSNLTFVALYRFSGNLPFQDKAFCNKKKRLKLN